MCLSVPTTLLVSRGSSWSVARRMVRKWQRSSIWERSMPLVSVSLFCPLRRILNLWHLSVRTFSSRPLRKCLRVSTLRNPIPETYRAT